MRWVIRKLWHFDYDAELAEAQRHVDQLPVVVLVPDARIE